MPNPPIRIQNKERRSREYLMPAEVEKLISAARKIGRYGHRNATMIMMAFRHGLRVSELVSLKWLQVDLENSLFHVNRRKNGVDCTHPLYGPELRALRKIKRDYLSTQYIFITERKGPMTDSAFRKIVESAGRAAKLRLPVHPHMLRHSTGFKLANDGRDTRSIQHYLGHRNIQNTVKYTEIVTERFKEFWID